MVLFAGVFWGWRLLFSCSQRHSGTCSGPCPSLFWLFEEFGAGKVFLLFADVAFGTGEGLLGYGMDVLYRRGAPGVRDAFSKALGAKNRRFRYGRDIRYQKPPPTVRD